MRNVECGMSGQGSCRGTTCHVKSAFRIPHSALGMRGAAVRVVAVFGGGGAKSLACAGAWRALREAGLEIAHIVGTSMGAVIGAALASGATYDEVVIAARSLSRRDVAPIDPLALVKGVFAGNLFKPEGLRRAIERLVPATRFEALQTPFTLTATDLDSGELLLFGAGGRVDVPLHDALYASCALPLRSEEHTSELQSRLHFVFPLLL